MRNAKRTRSAAGGREPTRISVLDGVQARSPGRKAQPFDGQSLVLSPGHLRGLELVRERLRRWSSPYISFVH